MEIDISKKKIVKEIAKVFRELMLPNNRIIVIHARIKSIRQEFGSKYSYSEITESIINYLNKTFEPKTLLIPCYTYSYTKSGIYHKLFSKSEVGRFSEEARLLGYYRTPDPIFSFLDVNNYLNESNINYNIAFGKGSIFEYMHQQDAVILNIGLDNFIATQRHYVEYHFDVDCRFNKYFSGIVYFNENKYNEVNYKYYVRDLARPTDGNLKKITKDLLNEDVLKTYYINDINISWLSCRPYLEYFKPKMKDDPLYHIK